MFSRKTKIWFWVSLLLVTPILLPGCGPKKEYGIVSGQVTLDGKPMTTGCVKFASQQDVFSYAGDIEPDGHFIIKTYDSKGIPPGDYKIAISGVPISTGQELTLGNPKTAFVPKRYKNPKTSGFEATLKKGENPSFQFDMTSK